MRPTESWWTPDQTNLVTDESRNWRLTRFQATAGFWRQEGNGKILRPAQRDELPQEGEIFDPNAWDHEHCALCWETISENSPDNVSGYTDGHDWLCVGCYDKYFR